jgi:site-specific DNA recombinase
MKAILYIRVSTEDQADPLNLAKQETCCRTFCAQRGYTVVEIFKDIESARTADRAEFQRMRLFCKQHRRDVDFVVVQDLSRLARNSVDQGQCIADLRALGVKLFSVYEPNVDDTAAGRFAAGMLGAVNEFFSNSLSEKMRDRMRASVAAGRFPFPAPIGYINTGGTPNIIPDPERAPLIRRAFELIAAGHKRADVLKTITDAGLRTRRGNRLTPQVFYALLHKPIYCGWISPPSMNIRVQGSHEPIVSEEIFSASQQILLGKKAVVAHKRVNPGLPLKVFVRCAVCGTPLTGGICRGRTKTYERYWCRKKGCRAVKTSKQNLETTFIHLLKRLSPRAEVRSSFPKIAERVFAQQQAGSEANTKRLTARLEKFTQLKSALLTAKLSGEVLQDDYEEARARYAREIVVIGQELQAAHVTGMTLAGFLRFVELSLMDIAAAWARAAPAQRQRVQTLLFEDGLSYDQSLNSLNHSNPCLFNVLEQITTENFLLASLTVQL